MVKPGSGRAAAPSVHEREREEQNLNSTTQCGCACLEGQKRDKLPARGRTGWLVSTCELPPPRMQCAAHGGDCHFSDTPLRVWAGGPSRLLPKRRNQKRAVAGAMTRAQGATSRSAARARQMRQAPIRPILESMSLAPDRRRRRRSRARACALRTGMRPPPAALPMPLGGRERCALRRDAPPLSLSCEIAPLPRGVRGFSTSSEAATTPMLRVPGRG